MLPVIGLLFVCVEAGLVMLVLVLLNARDRRRERASAAVLGARRPWRGCLGIRVRSRMVSRRALVVVDASLCAGEEAPRLLHRLRGAVSSDVEIVVDMRLDGLPVTVALSHPEGLGMGRAT